MLHEEVGRLPEKYRAAVVLCYWEGLTHEQAADRLRWPVGTVRSRLSWARQRLRSRLTRRGLAPAAAMAVGEVSMPAPGGARQLLVERTVQGALQLAAGQVPAGVVSASAWVLTEGVIRTMMLARWKMTAARPADGRAHGCRSRGARAAGGGRDAQRPVTTKGEEHSKVASPGQESDIDQKIRTL